MKYKVIAAVVAIAVSAPVATTPVFASGGGGGGGGGFGGGGFGSSQRAPRVQLTPAQRSFKRGQKAYKKSVACKKCAYPNGITATKTANEVVQKVKSGQIKVKANRQKDLLYYLSQRYRVRT